MRKVFLTLSLTIFSLIFFKNALAECKCLEPGDPQKELNNSTAVFTGKATDKTDNQVFFQITKSYKGVGALETVSVIKQEDLLNCGFLFEIDKEYIVYANKNGKGELTTSSCSRTNELALAQEDIDQLGGNTTDEETVTLTQAEPKRLCLRPMGNFIIDFLKLGCGVPYWWFIIFWGLALLDLVIVYFRNGFKFALLSIFIVILLWVALRVSVIYLYDKAGFINIGIDSEMQLAKKFVYNPFYNFEF